MDSRKLSICCCKAPLPAEEALGGAGAGRRWMVSRRLSICLCRLPLAASLIAGTAAAAAAAAASAANVTSRRLDRDVGSSVCVSLPPRVGLRLRDELAERLPSPPVLRWETLVDRRGLAGGLGREETAAEAEALLRVLRGLTGGVEEALDFAGLAERCVRPSAEAERLRERGGLAGALRGLAGGVVVDDALDALDDAARVEVESLEGRALERPAAAEEARATMGASAADSRSTSSRSRSVRLSSTCRHSMHLLSSSWMETEKALSMCGWTRMET